MRLTETQKQVLKFVADGEFLGFGHMEALSFLQRKNLIEEVKTSFISQVSLRITDLGRAALAQSVEES